MGEKNDKNVDFFEKRVSFFKKLLYFCNRIDKKMLTEKWQSWFNALVLKTSVPLRVPGVRIPLSPLKASKVHFFGAFLFCKLANQSHITFQYTTLSI